MASRAATVLELERQCNGAAAAIAGELERRVDLPSIEYVLDLATRTGYAMGLEVGLQVAEVDPGAVPGLVAFFNDVVQRGSPDAIAARIHKARDLAAADRADA